MHKNYTGNFHLLAKAPGYGANACPSLIPGSGRAPGKGNGKQLQYSCLGNSIDRGALWATVHGAAKSRMTKVTEYAHRQKQ